MLLVVVVDKSIIQRTICSIIRPRVSIVEQSSIKLTRGRSKNPLTLSSPSPLSAAFCCLEKTTKDSISTTKKFSIRDFSDWVRCHVCICVLTRLFINKLKTGYSIEPWYNGPAQYWDKLLINQPCDTIFSQKVTHIRVHTFLSRGKINYPCSDASWQYCWPV